MTPGSAIRLATDCAMGPSTKPSDQDKNTFSPLTKENWGNSVINPFDYGFQTGTLANSEDLDEMLHYAAFHQGLHCLQR